MSCEIETTETSITTFHPFVDHDLDAEHLAEAEFEAERVEVEAGDYILGNDWNLGLLLVESGWGKVIVPHRTGHNMIVKFIGPGHTSNMEYAASPNDLTTFGRAVTDMTVCLVPYWTIRSLMAWHPALGITMSKLVSAELKAMQARLADLSYESASVRLAYVMSESSRQDAKFRIVDMADFAGMSEKQAVRILQSWRDRKGRIETSYIDRWASRFEPPSLPGQVIA